MCPILLGLLPAERSHEVNSSAELDIDAGFSDLSSQFRGGLYDCLAPSSSAHYAAHYSISADTRMKAAVLKWSERQQSKYCVCCYTPDGAVCVNVCNDIVQGHLQNRQAFRCFHMHQTTQVNLSSSSLHH